MITIEGKKRLVRYAAQGLCVYGLLVAALLAAESASPDALIDTVPKAIWYSLVTLSTVGYGDLYPVTWAGRAVSLVFLLLSTGLLALLVGMAISAVSGRLFPRARLWLRRREKWYVFASLNAASQALAGRLEDGLVVWCGKAGKGRDALSIEMSPEALFALPYAARGERYLFAMDDDAVENERLAAALMDRPVRIYCRGDGLDGALPDNVVVFSDVECTARLYWQTRPWQPEGERVALIGDGRCAQALLTQGLLTASPGCAFELFGDWPQWRSLHWALEDAPDRSIELRYHREDWRDRPALLREAARVVLCADDACANRELLHLIKRYCVVHGQIDARCAQGLERGHGFGEPEALFTPELVMQQTMNRRARQLHEIYRAQADYPVPAWEELPDFLKRSNLAAADHLLTKLRLLLPEADVREVAPEVCARAAERFEAATAAELERYRRIEHARWALFHALYNWRYAPARDKAERLHPMMVPYEQLSEAERAKDENAWKLLRTLANEEEA